MRRVTIAASWCFTGANSVAVAAWRGMGRRRADGGPGLLARVRWGNVGRLAALLAAALLVFTGPRGCGPAEQPSPPEAGVNNAAPQREVPPSPPPAATPAPSAPPAAPPKRRRV